MSTRGQGRYYEEEPDPAGQHSTPSELFDMLLNAQRKRDAEHHTEEVDTLYIANSKGEKIPLSPDMYAPLETILRAQLEHKAVTLVQQDRMMTTQEAADYLGMSRPTLVRLLEDGKIPFEKLKKHRRVAFADVETYRAHRMNKK